MRIRRRTADVLHHPQAASLSRARSPAAAAPPSSAPSLAPVPPSETAAARWGQLPGREVDPSMCGEKPFDPRRPSCGRNRQEEEKEESDKAAEDEKRREEDGRPERDDGRPVHVVCSTRAAPKRQEEEEEERRTAAEEKKSGDCAGTTVKDEEKSTSAAMCKKGDGKGWHCKREAHCGYSLCQYHLDKLRSYACYSHKKMKRKKKKKKKPKSAPASVSEQSAAAAGIHPQAQGATPQKKKRNKRRRMEEHVLGTGPAGASDSFYYYSGFGPRWGKRRGGSSADVTNPPDGADSELIHPRQDVGDAAADAAGEEEEEDEHDLLEGSSREGKPWKSRALSSIL